MSLLNAQYAAISAINAIVTSDEPMDKVHESIQLVRRHLESRAQQTARSAEPDLIASIPAELQSLFG